MEEWARNHIEKLGRHGACIRVDQEMIPLTVDFCDRALDSCKENGFNAVTYDLKIPEADEMLMLAIWADGHVDSGSVTAICRCLAKGNKKAGMWVYTEKGEQVARKNGITNRIAGEHVMIGSKPAEERNGIARTWAKAGFIEWREEEE